MEEVTAPSVSKYLSLLNFFCNFHSSHSKNIVQVQFILFAICFNVVCILNLTYCFTCLR
jgi:hypothetical protein